MDMSSKGETHLEFVRINSLRGRLQQQCPKPFNTIQTTLQYVIIFDRQKKNACSPRAYYICQFIWLSVVSFCVLSLIVAVPDNRAGMGYQEIVQTAVCQPSETVPVEQIKNVFLITAHQYGFVDRENFSLLLHPPVRHALNVETCRSSSSICPRVE